MVFNENLNRRLTAMTVNSVSSVIKTIQPLPNNKDETDENKNQVKAFNFMDSFKPVYFVLRLLGLKPFSIIYNSNGEPQRPKITVFDGIQLLISLSVYALMAYCVEEIDYKKFSAEGFIYVLAYILTMFGLFCSVSTILINMCNRFKFVEILRKIVIFDNEMASVGVHFDYEKTCQRNWLYCIVPIVTAFTIMLISITTDVNNYIYNDSIVFIQRSMSNISAMSFIVLLHSLCERFASLNSHLSNVNLSSSLPRKRNRFLNEKNSPDAIERNDLIDTIKFIGRQHSFLTGIVDLINFCFTFEIIFNTARAFEKIIFTLYIMNLYVVHQNEAINELFYFHLTWMIARILYILIAVYNASHIIRGGKRTARIVHDIINNCSLEANVESAFGKISQQLQHRYPIVSCGLFEYNWTLVTTLVAATTSYLTILLSLESYLRKI